jgi:hypothetical protein
MGRVVVVGEGGGGVCWSSCWGEFEIAGDMVGLGCWK